MGATLLHCKVSGRVQGVGFRYSALHKALALGLNGWVKNLPDRAVETLAWGDADSLASYRRWLETGPSFARVSGIEIIRSGEIADDEREETGFDILY